MRTALVSDTHGNLVALRAVLAALDAEGIDRIVCLGDVAQGGPQPAECVELLAERRIPTVIGNADAFLLEPATAEGSHEPVTERQLEARQWTLEQLGPEHRALIERYEPTIRLELGGGRTLLACHGSPASYDDWILPSTPEDEFRARLDGVEDDLVAGGHMHLQFVRRRGATTFLNPGSVGLGYDHEQDEASFRADPWASYAVVTSAGALSIDLRRVPFTVAEHVAAIRASGMPDADEVAGRWAD